MTKNQLIACFISAALLLWAAFYIAENSDAFGVLSQQSVWFLWLGFCLAWMGYLAFSRQATREPWPKVVQGQAWLLSPLLLLGLKSLALRVPLPPPHQQPAEKIQLLFVLAAFSAVFLVALKTALLFRTSFSRGQVGSIWFFCLPLCWYVLFSFWTAPWNMTGDAPHYLLITHSLAYDGDLDIQNNYQNQDYGSYYHRGTLIPQEPERGGHRYSWHQPLLPLLLALPYRLAGWWAAVLEMCCFSALLAWACAQLCAQQGYGPEKQWWAWSALSLSAPLFSQSAIIYSEVPAALSLALWLWDLHRFEKKQSQGWLLGLSMLSWPWWNNRFDALFPPACLAIFLCALPALRRCIIPLVFAAATLGGQLLYNLHYFDGLSAGAALATDGAQHFTDHYLNWRYFATGAPGLLWDGEFGLFVYTPLWILAWWGNWLRWKKGKDKGHSFFLLFGTYFLVLACWSMWWGQIAPNRFFTVMLPFLALGLAEASPHDGLFKKIWVWSGGLSIFWAWLFSIFPALAYNRGEGINWEFKLLKNATGVDLSFLLPSFMVPSFSSCLYGIILSLGLAAFYLLLAKKKDVSKV